MYQFLPSMMLDHKKVDGQFPYLPSPVGSSFLHFRMNVVDVYNHSGAKLCQVANLEAFANSRAAFWCVDGCIGVLHHSGDVSIVTTAGELVQTVAAPDSAHVVVESAYPGGVAFVTDTKAFWVFNSSDLTWCRLAAGHIPDGVAVMAYAEGAGYIAYADESGFEEGRGVLAQVTADGIKHLDALRFHPWGLRVSPRGDLIAAYDQMRLYVRSPKSQIVFPLITQESQISSLAFLDDLTIVYVADRTVHIVSQSGTVTKWDEQPQIPTVPLVTQGIDCVRLLYRGQAWMMCPIHPTVMRLFQNPVAERLERLVSAKTAFDDKHIDSYNLLEELKPVLESLILTILEAAINIIEKDPCERLLQHAAFAKYQLPSFDHNVFRSAIRDMQSLNTLRTADYGWLITGHQYQELARENCPRMLSNIIQSQSQSSTAPSALELAGSFCHLYHLNVATVAEHWASRMFRDHRGAAVDGVLRKLAPYDPIDYVRLANAARKYTVDIPDICKIIRGARDPKVRMLYILNDLANEQDAMQDVLQSLDGNAIICYLAIARLRLPHDQFGARLGQSLVLADQYAAYRKFAQFESILQIESFPPLRAAAIEFVHGGEARLPEVLRRLNFAEKNSPWAVAIQHYQAAAALAGAPAPSARQMLAQAIAEGKDAVAHKIAKQYKISDKMVAWVQLRTYVRNKEWNKVTELVKKSQPLPWEAYAETCAAHDRREDAVAFIKKISSPEQRLNLFQQYEYWGEAANTALEMKNQALYAELNAKAVAQGDD
jgi:hypothetical protein